MMISSWQESDDKPKQYVEKQRHYSADKGLYSQGNGLPSGHVQLWELDQKQGRIPKNWCLWTVVLKTSESPLDSKEIKPVNLKGDQPWMFTGRTDAEAEAPVLGHQMGTDDSLEKSPMMGKIEGRRRRGHQRMRWMDISKAMNMNLGKLWEMVSEKEAWSAAIHEVAKSWTLPGNWTTTSLGREPFSNFIGIEKPTSLARCLFYNTFIPFYASHFHIPFLLYSITTALRDKVCIYQRHTQTSKPNLLVLIPKSATYLLCDLGKVSKHLWASISHPWN